MFRMWRRPRPGRVRVRSRSSWWGQSDAARTDRTVRRDGAASDVADGELIRVFEIDGDDEAPLEVKAAFPQGAERGV